LPTATPFLGPERLRALPKTDLHCHLDGSLRLETILDLAREQGIALPAQDAAALAERLHVGVICESLEHYLEAFGVTLSVLQTAPALTRVTRELVEDAAAEGVWCLEVRFSPVLHQARGLSAEVALVAVLEGLAQARAKTPIETGVIVCGLRHLPPSINVALAELAVSYRDKGVRAFDLAGGEDGFPASAHVAAYDVARANDLGLTVHAGEGAGAHSIREAVHICGAHRIGHGTRLFEDERLLRHVNDRRIALEVCPTSNEQTRAVHAFAAHPLAQYLRLGLRVTLNTDNRLMSATTVTREIERCVNEIGLGVEEVRTLLLNGFKAAFLDREPKKAMIVRAAAEITRVLSP